MVESKSNNPYDALKEELDVDGQKYQMYNISKLDNKEVAKLPVSIRVLLEAAIRNCDNFNIQESDIAKIINWKETSEQDVEVPFKPARVILQDFTGVPAVVDLAAMRTIMKELGGDPQKINPLCQVDLVIDHSIQVDAARTLDAKDQNEELEFQRNKERFAFLKWGEKTFSNFTVVPPGNGIVHQVNLEYLASVVFNKDGMLCPDSVVGTDSHTTMIDGLGVVGWGVGGIEAESVMLGQQIAMVLPKVVMFQLDGVLPEHATATDLVLTITAMLRKRGVVGQFVEFCGNGCKNLSLTDRATIANMSPEYGATMGFFPVDEQTIKYLESIGTDSHKIKMITAYLKAQGLYDQYDKELYGSGERMVLDLATVVPCVSGPKRPHDRVTVKDLKSDFASCMASPQGFKGFAVPEAERTKEVTVNFEGKDYTFKHGSLVIAAITSCTNTSNPSVMMQAGLLARNALAKGLTTRPYIKTSLSPGSGVVTAYMEKSGVDKDLAALGFTTAGYGCMTCIGNSGNLPDVINNCITDNDMVASAVLSGNRNFEGRVHPLTKGNYLASPALVVAYALAGTVDIDFEVEPLGMDQEGNPVMLKDIWPARSFVNDIVQTNLTPQMFKDFYANTLTRNQRWNNLEAPTGDLFEWSEESTYIHYPPFFAGMSKETPTEVRQVKDAHCLCLFGDSITTDHISPAGNIAKTSCAAKFLSAAGVEPKDFNSYGSRRGNDLVMARGTFANVRIINKMLEKPGPNALHVPSGEQMAIYDAAAKYQSEGHPLIILAGKEYGSGSSRDWAAKGPYLQGIKVVIAQSYERIHRSNLLGMGIMPLQFKEGESSETHGLNGHEKFTFEWGTKLSINQDVTVTTSTGKTFTCMSRLDTDPEIAYYMNGGILHYVLRKLF